MVVDVLSAQLLAAVDSCDPVGVIIGGVVLVFALGWALAGRPLLRAVHNQTPSSYTDLDAPGGRFTLVFLFRLVPVVGLLMGGALMLTTGSDCL